MIFKANARFLKLIEVTLQNKMGKVPVRSRISKNTKNNRFDRSSFDRKKKNTTSRIKAALKKAITSKKGLTCEQILKLASSFSNFIGCFAQDTIINLQIRTKPVYFLVNIDSSGLNGSHWIAIGLFDELIEVFDPLGFKIFNWSSVPCSLLTFIHNYSANRKLLIADRVQSQNSLLCGFYCLFYVMKRSTLSLSQICSLFSKRLAENDKILATLF